MAEPARRPRPRRRRQPNAVDRLLAAVRELVEATPNKAELARRAGVDEKSVRQAGEKGWNPRAETLACLVGVLPGAAPVEAVAPGANGSASEARP